MLSSLQIENVAVIQKAEVHFEPGLNVLTGETGAGKSILIDSINAILGNRTSKDLVRTGAAKAVIRAAFEQVPPAVLDKLEQSGYERSEALLLSREITLEELADEAAASGSGEQEASASAPQQETGAVSSPAGSSASSGSAASRTESSSTASSSKQETAGTANSGTEKPASSSGKQEAGYEAEVKALLRQLYSVKARAEAELNSCIAGAKAEFKSLPESQQTQARKISIVLARSGRLYAMQASYDREVESIVSQMRAILTANGQSTALADQAMASYKAQKSAMYSRLTAKLYS